MANIPNQSNYQDSQNFDIDIESIYTDFIKEIDANRSIVNTSNQGNQIFLKVLKKQTITSLAKLVKVEDTPQESRCHAFFRLIGFPVVSKDLRYYNPGFDIIKDPDREITLDLKIDIANNPFDGFVSLSFRRESYVNSILQTFSQNNTITSSVLSLSSSTQVRPFAAPVKSSDAFDTKPENQSYTADFKGQIGNFDSVKLTEYQDENGNKPILSQLNQTRFHFIKPFIVDPKIDFTVAPSSRKVAIPFALNKSNLLIAENTFVKRPLLEKVIRDRFSVENSANLGTADTSIKNYILSIPAVQDEALIKQMTSNVYKLSEQQQFAKYINIIRAMCKKLVEAQLVIQRVQSLYYWLPVPSSTGPEGGNTIKDIIISSTLPKDFITIFDKSLIDKVLKQISNQFNIQTSDVNGIPDVGGFAFDIFTNTFDNETSNSLGDVATQSVNTAVKNRKQHMNSAGAALRTIEIIMGEFSGLGLCDIIAVMGALYIMPKESLLGFLDQDSFTRMINSVDYIPDTVERNDITGSMDSFLENVKGYYNLMDKIYQDLKNNNGLS
jgi:hypothetical protein